MSKGKDDMRRQLASLSFSEKIKILEKLRDRSLVLAESGPRRLSGAAKQASVSEKKG